MQIEFTPSYDEDVRMASELDDPGLPPREETPPPAIDSSGRGRGQRIKRPTWKLLQQLPPPPLQLEELRPESEAEPDEPPSLPQNSEYKWQSLKTAKNSFGVFREYPSLPTHDPDQTLSLADQSDLPVPATTNPDRSRLSPLSAPPIVVSEPSSSGPFRNSTILGFMNWMWSGSIMKSIAECQRLIDFLRSDAFKKEDLKDFDLKAETAKFDNGAKDGWQEVDVEIQVPDGKKHGPRDPLPTFSVPGLHFRNLTQTIKTAFEDRSARHFHYTPFRQFWQPTPDEPEQRIYDEIYSSEAYIEAYEKLQRQPPEPDCTLERVVAALMWWSDSTHLANFGTALSVAALSLLRESVQLPDDFFDWYKDQTGHSPSADVLTHCRRELMHAIWKKLLDGEFLEACKHGIVIECPDGILRRFYFRFFTYSADYPEKVLLATIRNLGECPCPRCFVTKDKLDQFGTVRDDKNRVTLHRVDNENRKSYVQKARDWIYRLGHAVRGAKVERLLKPKSWVPTTASFSASPPLRSLTFSSIQNAFSDVASYSFNMFTMLVVDFMHEFELGVWKAVFTHLIRMLVADGGDVIQALNDRYRQVPTFGQATIRRFTNNASAMKKLAARNFEDLLQCALPVFEELFGEEHDGVILDLLFTLAYWHALAKLRLHTSFSIKRLKEVTTELGKQLRYFAKYTCAAFDTKELPREEAARGRRHAKKAAAAKAAGQDPPPAPEPGSKRKIFNMFTYKGHSLGNYVRTILFFGTTDSYSTQPGELEHRRVKRYYARTNKNNAVGQITQLERRETALLKISRQQKEAAHIPPIEAIPEDAAASASSKKRKRKAPQKTLPTLDFADSESLPFTPPEFHYHISQYRKFHFNLTHWLGEHHEDPAVKDFRSKLQEHLLGRLLHPNWSGDGTEYSSQERSRLLIVNDRIYRHKVLRINYTSYDIRRGQDSMNPRTRADIMMLAPEDATDGHLFSYARILGVFHCDVLLNDNGTHSNPVPLSFLWVRRFRLDHSYKGGFKRKRLHRIEFLPDSDPNAYGFVDPDEVIRGSHLIPAFAHGPTQPVEYTTLARKEDEYDDWRYHYVNFFVDRDMFMRYLGGGVGHYQVPVPDEDPEEIRTYDEEPEGEAPPGGEDMEDTPNADAPLPSPLADGLDDDDDEDSGGEEDEEEAPANGRRDFDEEEEEEEEEEPQFGPEDGENNIDDLAVQMGYDDL
ncbi:hypothetical protein MVEN_00708900 [Mycena venus]|uniref:Uncharacterized protein n=1 Tax=Mycena venus TaxID=2733690 RepID=A0A8H6YET6_9AGAR|nr:hypothetical protein MVEN_00708900 [Mycena venus]